MTLELQGDTPVLYFDQDTADMDGCGYNVLLASSGMAERFATLDEALVEYRSLLDNVGVRQAVEFVATTAPPAYDYGYSMYAGEVVTERFGTLRVLRVRASHVDYQIGRYQSGLYPVFRGATFDQCAQSAREF
jgi:hypothetical protein